MIYLLLGSLYLAQLVQGTTIGTSSDSCPPPDGATRSIWGILGSCALTLLICVWHAIHFNLPGSKDEWDEHPVVLVLLSFFVPEGMVSIASQESWTAHETVNGFHEKGYEWSMTHSFFAEMGGFVYHNDEGSSRMVKSLEFLELYEKNEIANPIITVKEIKDKSKSDALGKAILAFQLLWFMLQVIVRGLSGLAITLVELDTLAMAVLLLLLLFLWWDKPLRPECPYIFYSPQEVKEDPRTRSALSHAWKSEPGLLDRLIACFTRTRKRLSTIDDEETTLVDTDIRVIPSRKWIDRGHIAIASLCGTWMILGVLHVTTWNFHFPTGTEKIMWRVALAGTPLLLLLCAVLKDVKGATATAMFALILGVVSRALLVGLMLASLRALPCSAHQTVSWTTYIPHLQVIVVIDMNPPSSVVS